MTLSGLCTKNEVTLDAVTAVPVPAATRSYSPVSYRDAIEFVRSEAHAALGLDVVSERYGLNKKGDQMFGVLTMDTGSDRDGLAFGLRQSYNKSLALGCAAGSSVFVCDNLCFSGSAFRIVRKNTTNVWADFTRLIREQLATALATYERTSAECDAMAATPCETERGYAVLGVMQGHGLLTPNQASVAFGDWRTPRHAEFDRRDVWGLYNAVTEGLKKGPAARTMERHAAAHDFFVENLVPVIDVNGEVVNMPAPEARAHGIDEAQIGRGMLADMLG